MLFDVPLDFQIAIGGALVGVTIAVVAYTYGQKLAAKLGDHIPGEKMD